LVAVKRVRGGALAAAAVSVTVAFGVYAWRELQRQSAEIKRLTQAQGAASARQPAAASTVYLVQQEPGAGASQPPPPAASADPSDQQVRPAPHDEPSESEKRAADEARIARMYGSFKEQPVDGKAMSAQREVQSGFDGALAAVANTGVRHGAVDCRARWCSMSIQYRPDANLDGFDETIRGVLYQLSSTRGPPAISRLVKATAEGVGNEGMYFFRWKEEYW
jgi:hypothetical protein